MNRSTLCTILASLRSMYNVTKWDTFLSPVSEASVKALHDRWLPDIAVAARPEASLREGHCQQRDACPMLTVSLTARCTGLHCGPGIVGW